MNESRSTPDLPQDVLDIRAWDWAGRQLDAQDADAFIARVQDVVAQAARARLAAPQHVAWPRKGACSNVPLGEGSHRELLAQVEHLEALPEWRAPHQQALLGQARQELICALALQDGWPRTPEQAGPADESVEPSLMEAACPEPVRHDPPAVQAQTPHTPVPSARRRVEPPPPSWRRSMARRVGRRALQLSSRLLRGESLT